MLEYWNDGLQLVAYAPERIMGSGKMGQWDIGNIPLFHV
jgi:hypothetical protein